MNLIPYSRYARIRCSIVKKDPFYVNFWTSLIPLLDIQVTLPPSGRWSLQDSLLCHSINGCGMGPWLVLVSPCFRENVVATCKIGSFLCSLDNLLQKNVIVPFSGNQISKWRSFEKKRLFLTYFSYFLVTREKLQKFLQHISQTHVFCSPYIDFLPYQFWKKYEFIRYGFSLLWVLVLILIRAILEQSINNKMVSKI